MFRAVFMLRERNSESMANPQKEDGFTAIANEIMDALAHIRIPGEERQILDVILRKTYGFQKCEDYISLSQFMSMTGIKKPNVIRAIRGLTSKKMIIVIKKIMPSQISLNSIRTLTNGRHYRKR